MNINELNLEDETIRCADCNKDFIFAVGEQRYFLSKYLSPPKRCPVCRTMRRNSIVKAGGEGK